MPVRTKSEADVEINSLMFSSCDEEGKKIWVCGVCNFIHIKRDKLHRHVDKEHYHYSYSCELCGRIVPTQNALMTHINNKHRENKWFACILDLVKSKAVAESEISAMMIRAADENGKTSWFCGECNFSSAKQEVFRHIDCHHYKYMSACDLCGKFCQTWEALRIHVRRYHK